MKRTLLFVFSAVGLGALNGFLISDFPKYQSEVAVAAPAIPLYVASAPAKAVVKSEPAEPTTAFARVLSVATASIERARGVEKKTSVGLVLKEPVVVVRAGESGRANLPEGTPVDLVRSEGRFLRVRHDQTIVTIPRNSVVLGVVRTN